MSDGKPNEFIERHIVIGSIVSTRYLQQVYDIFDTTLLESPTAKRMATWAIEYYEKYQEAPGQAVEGIYYQKLKEGLDKETAEDIEDILEDLSEEYEREGFNVQYLLDQSRRYFDEKNLRQHSQRIQALADQGDITEAERLANEYRPLKKERDTDIDLSNESSLTRVEQAFDEASKPLVTYPGALGQFWNDQMTRDALVSLLAPEKRGKSYMLLDLARRAVTQRLNVAFFQAGDMSEAQQLRRLAIQLKKKSDREEYTGKMYEPVKDCIYNQTDNCNLKVRECDHGVFETEEPMSEFERLRNKITQEELIEEYKQNPDYRPCHNCSKFQYNRWGVPWMQEVKVNQPLEKQEAVRAFKDYFVAKKRRFMLSTHANNTLTVSQIHTILDTWYRQGFVPDVIVIDYADLLISSSNTEFRHKTDEVWRGLRNLSQDRHCLVVTATQADAASYERGLLTPSNFSEDKRKFAHVTACYGLNQDPSGREKQLGIMRINDIMIREGETKGVVHALQNLKRGQAVLTSYW